MQVILTVAQPQGAGSPLEIQDLMRQQSVLARFGELALRSEDLDEILTEACRLVGDALGTDLAKVVELQEDGSTLLVRAGVGWKSDVVGQVKLQLHQRSSEGHALKTGKPMVSPDIHHETRFEYPAFLKDNGVKAVVNVPIIGANGKPPFGVLQVDSRVPREFTPADILFLRSYANLLAGAVARLRALHELQDKNAQLGSSLEKCRRGAERQRFLSKELDHRAKNMLSVVQAVVRLTKADSVAGFAQVIEGRVIAMARAQNLLSASHWSGVELTSVLRGELGGFSEEGVIGPWVSLEGPALILPAVAVQPFAMAIHELATNAIKYGALSSEAGRLRILWRVDRLVDHVLKLRWAEAGGPLVCGPPDIRGFGSRVLTNTVRSQLGGTIKMAWEPTGLICDLDIPIRVIDDLLGLQVQDDG